MGNRVLLGAVGVWLLAGVIPPRTWGAEVAKPKEEPPAPWSEMKALVLRTPFDNIRYPHLGNDGSVTFITDDAYSTDSKGLNHGIYRYQADGSLVCLVRAGETNVPGEDATLKTIQGLQMDENGAGFAFNAFDTDKKRGLYHWSNGKLDTIARTGETVLPGDTGTITLVEYGSIHGNHLLYKAASAQYGAALVLHDLSNDQDQVLCHSGVAVPGHPDDTFEFIANTNWVSGDSVLFRAATVTNPSAKDGKGTEGIYGWFGIKDWTGASGEFAPERLQTVIDGGARMPVGEKPENATFNLFGSAPISGNNTAFEASGDKFSGIFAARLPDGPVRCIVNSQTEFDGPFKGHFTSFGGYPSVIGQNVIFTARAEEGDAEETEDGEENDDGAADARAGKTPKVYEGVFVYRLDRGELFTLTDNRAPLDDREVESYEIGGHVLVGDHFAVTVHFQDKSCRIYLGTIKPEAFKQLTEGASAPQKADPAP